MIASARRTPVLPSFLLHPPSSSAGGPESRDLFYGRNVESYDPVSGGPSVFDVVGVICACSCRGSVDIIAADGCDRLNPYVPRNHTDRHHRAAAAGPVSQ